jgi:integrase
VAYQRQDLKGRTRWVAQWTDPATGRVRQKSVRAKDKREADRLEFELQRHAQRQREGLEPLGSDGAGATVGWLLERWLSAKQHAPSATRDGSAVRKHVLASALADIVVSQLKASDVENFLDEKLAAGLAPQTVNHLRGYLSRAFTTARRKGWWTGVNPVVDVQRKPVPKGVVGDYLRVEEVPLVLEQLARRWRPLFATALYTGLRKSELRTLRKEDVDLERGLLLVRRSGARATTKGGHADAIPIHPELMAFLRHAIESSPSPLVFPGHDGEMFAEDTDLAAVLRRAMGRAGLVTHWTHVCRRHRCAHREDAPDNGQRHCPEHHCLLWPKPHVRPIRFHDLRHSAASLLFMAGADAVAVQKLLRHRDLRLTTETYGHLAPGYLQAELGKLRLLGKAKTAELVPRAAVASASRTADPRQNDPEDFPPGGGGGISARLPGTSTERETGVEPATLGLGSRCSTTELLPRTTPRRYYDGSPRSSRFQGPHPSCARSSWMCRSSSQSTKSAHQPR